MPLEKESEPNLAEYYHVSNDISFDDFTDVSLKNMSLAFILLGLIAFMVNALMVFLFMSQEWAVIWPQTSGAQIGVILMCFGGGLYLVDYVLEHKIKIK